MKRLLTVTAALLAAVAVLVLLTLPPARLVLAPAWSDGTIPGILHVHTVRSDGRGTPDDVAAAAAGVGLRFVVLTDHGDATRTPDPPMYRSGVLCLDAVEISTRGGHYVAIGLPPAPYPLGGDARDVVEDVRRLGGFGVVAHPDSPKPELQWHEWDAPFDAVEVINPDTNWRRWIATPGWRPKLRLLASLFDYPFRPAETLASLIGPPSDDLSNWDAHMHGRRVVALAGADAHAKIAPRNADPGDNQWSLPLPSYEASFRMMSVHVRAAARLSGNAATDAALIVRALRAGHLYVAIDGVATPPAFEFSATNEQGTVHEGDGLGAGGPVTLRVRSDAPPSFTTIVTGPNGFRSTDHHESDFTVQTRGEPGAYWAEIIATGRSSPVRWIIGNPIYVRADQAPAASLLPPAAITAPVFDGTTIGGWAVEHDATSRAALDVVPVLDGFALRLRYALAGPSAGQFAALTHETPGGLAQSDRLTFTARAEHPMRITVQLRMAGGAEDRWEQSAYVDTFDQERTIMFADMRPLSASAAPHPVLANVRSLMFVIDTVNTKPGSTGRVWIRAVALGGPSTSGLGRASSAPRPLRPHGED
jgi:hypothetical protein